MNTSSTQVQSLMNKVPTSVVDRIVELNQQMEAARRMDDIFARVVDEMKTIFSWEFTVKNDEFHVAVNNGDLEEQILLVDYDQDGEKTICCTMRIQMLNEECDRYSMMCRLESRMCDVPIASAELVSMRGNARTLIACVAGIRDEVKSLVLGEGLWVGVHCKVVDLCDY